jgi:hypothetical protein
MAETTADPPPPHDFDDLVEALAREAHGAWMETRLREGWRHGPVQDGGSKTTPLLVEYEELNEQQKEVDRKIVRTTLAGAGRHGWRVEPPSSHAASMDAASLTAFDMRLDEALERAGPAGTERLKFDMNDAAELTLPEIAPFSVLQRALNGARDHVEPAWREFDARALAAQKLHRTVAFLAIWPGTLAIVAAILQLVLAGTGRISAADRMLVVEVILVAVATVAVVYGIARGMHERRIVTRFIAERLRSLKFAALGWAELWRKPESRRLGGAAQGQRC